MKVAATSASPVTCSADAIVVAVRSDKQLTPAAKEVDTALGGVIQRLLDSGEFAAAHATTLVLYPTAGVATKCVLVVGMEEGTVDQAARISREAAGAAAKRLATKQRNQVAFFVPFPCPAAGVCGAMVGCTGQDLYRAERKLFPIAELQFAELTEPQLVEGQTLGEAVNWTRELVNTPPADMYPRSFVEIVQSTLAGLPIQSEVWDARRLEAEKCQAILAVGRGSVREPQLLMLHYRGASPTAPVLALVGKGVTFDSGGLSLKPSEGMLDMKCDMAGAATVVGAMQAIARLQLPVNVSAYCGLVENMVSGDSYKLGDVIRTRAGVTVEVHNTDAEGRLVLADTLDVARGQGVRHLIDLATLTGACMVALGRQVSGVFTNQQAWCDQVLQAANSAGDWAWQMPMLSLYNELISSPVADIKNVGDGRWGGAITAAKFLERFVGDSPWVHVDIAGPSFSDRSSNWLDGGASGCFVPTLIELAKRYAGGL
ncbi:MAG: leucyl aminopeptidase [Planctomycetaceae bacterium]|nr:leucyl aminopeptidase [Planctomycetaceae bacterium]